MAQQATLFDDCHSAAISISEVANTLSVSEASVRNWIKTGYLEYDPATGVSQASFDHFKKNIAGKIKLTKRANKSLVDDHNHEALVEKTLGALKVSSNLSDLSDKYQNSLSNAYRNKEGIYYTPDSICEAMFSDVPTPKEDEKFCDPCCGSGNFIIAAIRHGFAPKNVFGYDTDPVAVEIAKQRVLHETGVEPENIICADFLEVSTNSTTPAQQFDVILTNPPWGKKIQKLEKQRYGKTFGAGRSLDTSSLFFFAAMKNLREHGFLSFLMPESFFKIATFQDARRHSLKYSLVSVRDFGKPFKGLLTKAQSFCVKKSAPAESRVLCHMNERKFFRKQKTFVDNPASIINFECSPEDAAVIAKVFDRPHITLTGGARWGLGIVTGNNKKFCNEEPSENSIPVYKGVDVHRGRADDPTTFIPSDMSLYQQVAPLDLFESKSKILYRFISSRLVFYHDKDGSYFLNSVNMIVPSPEFPIAPDKLVKLFNTDFYDWLFSKLFNTHKILRADLERLPLPVEFLREREDFTEDQLIKYYEIERTDGGAFRVKS